MEWEANELLGDAVASGIVKTAPNLILIVPKIEWIDDNTMACHSLSIYMKGMQVSDSKPFLIQFLRIIADQMEVDII